MIMAEWVSRCFMCPDSKCSIPWRFLRKYREYFYIIIKCWVACGSSRIAAASSSIITGGLVTGTNSVRYSAHGATPSILRITQSSHQINWKMSRQLKIYHVCTISKFSLWPSVSWISPQCRACDIKIKNIYWDGRSWVLLPAWQAIQSLQSRVQNTGSHSLVWKVYREDW